MSDPETVVREACHVIWTEGDVDRVAEFYSDDFVADYPMTDWGTGVAGVQRLAAGIRQGFPDYREQIDELLVAGDDVIVRLTIRGTNTGAMAGNPPSGKAVEFRDVSIITVREGKITRQRGLTDYLTMYQQLGLVALPAA